MVHLTLVVVVHFPEDVSDMVLGATNPSVTLALRIVSIWLIGVVLFPIWAAIYLLRHQRRLQIKGTAIVEPVIRFLFGGLRSRHHFTKAAISPDFWGNDYPSEIESYQRLAGENFAPWNLTVGGLEEHPLTLSLDNRRGFPKPEQITKYNRIQVWSAVGQMGRRSMSKTPDQCRPLPQARYVVFNAFHQAEYSPDVYEEVLTLEEITASPTMLAYEMNWNSLPVPHVAPFRLRIKIKTDYQMVKYDCAIEMVDSVDKIGKGFKGYREDHRYDDKIAATRENIRTGKQRRISWPSGVNAETMMNGHRRPAKFVASSSRKSCQTSASQRCTRPRKTHLHTSLKIENNKTGLVTNHKTLMHLIIQPRRRTKNSSTKN